MTSLATKELENAKDDKNMLEGRRAVSGNAFRTETFPPLMTAET